MTTIYDVDVNDLIEKAAEELKKIKEIQPPEWAAFVKTGVHKERPPIKDDWWYARCAAVLRAIYILGPIGTSKLRVKYGGKKRRGYQPPTFKKGSGSVIRHVLQQLEKAGLAKQENKKGHKGRIVTPKGKSLLDKVASSMVPKKEAKAKKAEEPKVEKPKAEEKKEAKPAEAKKTEKPKKEQELKIEEAK
ncbi:30S ribosomal protein S19e [Candidatus Woesearchaeota archaeon]|nr:30S ribosomal protein S19e [Candidatus Woesearchaeota archaeon]